MADPGACLPRPLESKIPGTSSGWCEVSGCLLVGARRVVPVEILEICQPAPLVRASIQSQCRRQKGSLANRLSALREQTLFSVTDKQSRTKDKLCQTNNGTKSFLGVAISTNLGTYMAHILRPAVTLIRK